MGQVDKNLHDIPMQKSRCREFIDLKSDWSLHKEFAEMGVSGYKTSAKDRDAIVELKTMALKDEFDILLVFMFDRLGRKDDETPFVVEWFVDHGIEVWSVIEGQQRFDSHVDKLTNYIRFWQASGESLNTSTRVKSHMAEEVKQGHFKGGTPAFGYRLVHNGRVNKRGREVYDLEIWEPEAKVVRYIFDLYVNHGLGTQTIARRLESEGIMNRKGGNFVCPTIKNIITNQLYIGIMKCGETIGGPFEHLRIIDDEIFSAAKDIAEQRSNAYQEKRKIPRKIAKHCLLTGIVFCDHCGGRLVTSTSLKKRKTKDGNVSTKRIWRYVCYNNMRHKRLCDGQSGYQAKKVDEAVEEAIMMLLSRIKKVPKETIIAQCLDKRSISKRDQRDSLIREKRVKERDLRIIKDEIVGSLRGKSRFSPDTLNDLLFTTESELSSLEQRLAVLEADIQAEEDAVERLLRDHDMLISYSDMFESCSLEQKRMIMCKLIDEIRVSRGYAISMKLSFTIEQFLNQVDSVALDQDNRFVVTLDSMKDNE